MTYYPVERRWRLAPSRGRTHGAAILAAYLILSLAATSVKAVRPVGDAITLRGAIAAALLRSPRLKSFSYALRAAEAERIQARLRPNPDISAQLENLGSTGELRGTSTLEATLLLSQLLELGDKRARRERAAARALDLCNVDYEIQRLDVLAEIA